MTAERERRRSERISLDAGVDFFIDAEIAAAKDLFTSALQSENKDARAHY